jgi:excinuclease ABC subunit B
MDFKLNAPFIPMGDQPEAIRDLVQGVRDGKKNQVLLGATGTGKTFTIASVIQELQKPALIMAHNTMITINLKHMFRAAIFSLRRKRISTKRSSGCVSPQLLR